jgi:hypothetical protein
MNFRTVRLLVGGYLVLSVLTVATVVTLAQVAPAQVNPEAWVRSIIVAATSVLTFAFATSAARGRPKALLRLRIVVAIILVAIIAVLAFVPLPEWMIFEQAACGVLLAIVATLIFRRRLTAGATS